MKSVLSIADSPCSFLNPNLHPCLSLILLDKGDVVIISESCHLSRELSCIQVLKITCTHVCNMADRVCWVYAGRVDLNRYECSTAENRGKHLGKGSKLCKAAQTRFCLAQQQQQQQQQAEEVADFNAFAAELVDCLMAADDTAAAAGIADAEAAPNEAPFAAAAPLPLQFASQQQQQQRQQAHADQQAQQQQQPATADNVYHEESESCDDSWIQDDDTYTDDMGPPTRLQLDRIPDPWRYFVATAEDEMVPSARLQSGRLSDPLETPC